MSEPNPKPASGSPRNDEEDRTAPPFPDMEGYWLGGRKPTPEEVKETMAAIKAFRATLKRGPESMMELRDAGRRRWLTPSVITKMW